MSKEKTAESWLRVLELREQKTKMEVARVQSQLAASEHTLAALEEQLTTTHNAMREQSSEVVSVASIELFSRGLAADEAAVARAREAVLEVRSRLAEVVAMHSEASKKRMVAERYRDRLKRERIEDWQRKQDREASDRAGRMADD